MKFLHFLAFTVPFTSAAIIARRDAEPREYELERRVWGNVPGERGYNYRDDPEWRGNGGRYSSQQLMDDDEYERRNRRNPPPELRPARENPPVERQSTSESYGSREQEQPERKKQVERIRSLSITDKKKYPNGDERVIQVGAQIPFPKQGFNPYTKVGVSAGVDKSILTPNGRVTVASNEVAGNLYGLGPCFIDTSYSFKQDLNPAPAARPPPPQEVNPVPGRRGTYYMDASDGTKRPVYLDNNGYLYSERSGKRIHGNPPVYLRNGPGNRRRDNVLGTIESQTNAPANSSSNLQAEWQLYYNVYTGLRANATNLLMPIFNDLVSKSNTTYVYEMAWSIHSQLTGSPNVYWGGAYLNGLTNFDDFADSWLLSQGFLLDTNGTIYRPTNNTISNSTLLAAAQMLTITSTLQATYYEVWNSSVAALNVTQQGSNYTLLEDLVYFAQVVTANNNTKIIPESFTTVDYTSAAAEAAWFLDGINKYY